MLPVLDTTQVFIKRLLAGKNPLSTPGKDHLHHRLLAWGFSQRRASLILWSLTLFFNVLAMSIQAITLAVIFASASAVILLMSATLLPRIRSNS